MRFRINYETPEGDESFFEVEASDIETIKIVANEMLKDRGGINPWSEEL